MNLRIKTCCRTPAALLVLWLAPIPVWGSDKRSSPAQVTISDAGGSGRVAASGSLSQSEAAIGETVRFWLTIENRSSRAIQSVRLHQIDVPAFTIKHLAWRNEKGEQHCDLPVNFDLGIGTADLSSCGDLANELQPQQSLSVEGELETLRAHDRQHLTLLVEWKNLNNLLSQSAVPLGDAVIRSGWGKFWSRAYQAVKDFALPVVLALLAFGLGLWDKAREGQRQKEERHRTQLAETWNKMLSESHRLTTRYYLHIASACESMLEFDRLYKQEESKGAQKSAARLEEYAKRQLFSLVYLERRYLHLLDSAGGFYFKSRMGERLVNECLVSFLGSYTDQWKEEIFGNLTEMSSNIGLNETGGSFLKKLKGGEGTPKEVSDALAAGWVNFQKWRAATSYELALSYLRALGAILSYEMNRPYEYWYGDKERLVIDNSIRAILTGFATAIGVKETRERFAKELEEYLSGA